MLLQSQVVYSHSFRNIDSSASAHRPPRFFIFNPSLISVVQYTVSWDWHQSRENKMGFVSYQVSGITAFQLSTFVWLFVLKKKKLKVSIKYRKYQYYHFSDLCCFVSNSGRPRAKIYCLQMYADHFISQFVFTFLLISGVACSLRCIFEEKGW